MTSPSLSVVIPTCQRPEFIEDCLRRLLPTRPADRPCEIIVTDDSSDDRTRALITQQFPEVNYLAGPRKGPAANRNLGASAATGNWLIFLDDDCQPRPSWLPSYAKAIKALPPETRAVLTGPTLRIGAQPSLLWEAPYCVDNSDLTLSCNFAIPRGLFQESGGFDDRYPMSYFEDTDFFSRMITLQVPSRFVDEAIVDHPWRKPPSVPRAAKRWEARVISSLDVGMTPLEVLWRLPKHIAQIMISRFRGMPGTKENRLAALRFAGEFFLAVLHLPGWLLKHAKGPRSAFWSTRYTKGETFRL